MATAKKAAQRKARKRSALAEKLNRVLRKSGSVKAGERVGVAVSGGADSVALLRLFVELRTELGVVVVIAHFNHQLRGRTSDADERFVAQLAEQFNLEFFVGREDVAARARRERGNLEDAGRRARYEFFEKLQRGGHVAKMAVAHTADDQAETVLAHIVRGTGLSGLQGIRLQTGLVFRPLLGIRRVELRRYLKAIRQNWREDATNRDTKRMRARIRQKLLPMLERDFNPGVVEHLCALAELAGEDDEFLETRAAEWIDGNTKHIQRGANEVPVQLAELMRTQRALRSRIIRGVVGRVKTRAGQLSKEHVEAVSTLATLRDSGKALMLPGGVEVRRERGVLRFSAIVDAAKSETQTGLSEYAYEFDLNGDKTELPLVELSCVLSFWEIDWPAEGRETSDIGAVLDRKRLREPLVVRNWRAGDSMRPVGHQKAHKLARLLNEKSVTRWEKAKWPVLTSGGKVAWTRGLRESAEFAVGPETRRAVVIVEETKT